jgi:hypothetical protein
LKYHILNEMKWENHGAQSSIQINVLVISSQESSTRLRKGKQNFLIFNVRKPSIPTNGPSPLILNLTCLEKCKGNACVFRTSSTSELLGEIRKNSGAAPGRASHATHRTALRGTA